MSCAMLVGLIIGCLIAKCLPNPLIWLDEKYQERKYLKAQKASYDDYVARGFREETARYITGYRGDR